MQIRLFNWISMPAELNCPTMSAPFYTTTTVARVGSCQSVRATRPSISGRRMMPSLWLSGRAAPLLDTIMQAPRRAEGNKY